VLNWKRCGEMSNESERILVQFAKKREKKKIFWPQKNEEKGDPINKNKAFCQPTFNAIKMKSLKLWKQTYMLKV